MPPTLPTDPVSVVPTVLPRRALAATPGTTRAAPDLPAPVLPVAASRLADLWVEVVAAEPRTAVVSRTSDGLMIHATQRTAVLGFVDDVYARILPLGREEATIAVYSVARLGLWDMGVNRARVAAWLAALEARAARWTEGAGPARP